MSMVHIIKKFEQGMRVYRKQQVLRKIFVERDSLNEYIDKLRHIEEHLANENVRLYIIDLVYDNKSVGNSVLDRWLQLIGRCVLDWETFKAQESINNVIARQNMIYRLQKLESGVIMYKKKQKLQQALDEIGSWQNYIDKLFYIEKYVVTEKFNIYLKDLIYFRECVGRNRFERWLQLVGRCILDWDNVKIEENIIVSESLSTKELISLLKQGEDTLGIIWSRLSKKLDDLTIEKLKCVQQCDIEEIKQEVLLRVISTIIARKNFPQNPDELDLFLQAELLNAFDELCSATKWYYEHTETICITEEQEITFEEDVVQKLYMQDIKDIVFSHLNTRENLIVKLKFGFPIALSNYDINLTESDDLDINFPVSRYVECSFFDIAVLLRVSRTRVEMIYRKAMRKIKCVLLSQGYSMRK